MRAEEQEGLHRFWQMEGQRLLVPCSIPLPGASFGLQPLLEHLQQQLQIPGPLNGAAVQRAAHIFFPEGEGYLLELQALLQWRGQEPHF